LSFQTKRKTVKSTKELAQDGATTVLHTIFCRTIVRKSNLFKWRLRTCHQASTLKNNSLWTPFKENTTCKRHQKAIHTTVDVEKTCGSHRKAKTHKKIWKQCRLTQRSLLIAIDKDSIRQNIIFSFSYNVFSSEINLSVFLVGNRIIGHGFSSSSHYGKETIFKSTQQRDKISKLLWKKRAV